MEGGWKPGSWKANRLRRRGKAATAIGEGAARASEAARILAEELGVRISKAFSRFDSEPIASASLGQLFQERRDVSLHLGDLARLRGLRLGSLGSPPQAGDLLVAPIGLRPAPTLEERVQRPLRN